MTTSYDSLSCLPEATFVAGTEQTITFTFYEENGIDSLDVVSAVWVLCPYGDFGTIVLSKTLVEYET